MYATAFTDFGLTLAPSATDAAVKQEPTSCPE